MVLVVTRSLRIEEGKVDSSSTECPWEACESYYLGTLPKDHAYGSSDMVGRVTFVLA